MKRTHTTTTQQTRGARRAQTLLNHRLRIIGGRWRGTRIQFPALTAIRPTPDRVRETVFNWLQYSTVSARCLDLFAGSGALGLEALSRGAREVVFVDQELRIGAYLEATLQRLRCTQGQVQVCTAAQFLQRDTVPFDIAFLDPPFAETALLQTVCAQLEAKAWLVRGAHIYIECAAADAALALPSTWQVLRSKRAGQVGYHLARKLS